MCGLLLPQEKRASYFAIVSGLIVVNELALLMLCLLLQRAVNAEIAMIRDTVRTNPATGKIRMQWWRQKISELYASPETASKDTLLLRSLAAAIQEQDLTRRWFERILDARVRPQSLFLLMSSCLLTRLLCRTPIWIRTSRRTWRSWKSTRSARLDRCSTSRLSVWACVMTWPTRSLAMRE